MTEGYYENMFDKLNNPTDNTAHANISIDYLKEIKKKRLRENLLEKMIQKKFINQRVKESILNRLKNIEKKTQDEEQPTWVLQS